MQKKGNYHRKRGRCIEVHNANNEGRATSLRPWRWVTQSYLIVIVVYEIIVMHVMLYSKGGKMTQGDCILG